MSHLPDTDLGRITEKNAYRGLIQLRGLNVPLEYTPEQILEYKKCKKDIVYFVNNYMKIVSLNEGIKLFETYPYQDRMLNTMRDNRFTIAMMSRQNGKSVTVGAYLLHAVLFNPDFKIIIAANNNDKAKDILGQIKQGYEGLPWWLQHGVKTWNVFSIELENGTKVKASSPKGARGGSANILYIDEMSYIPNAQQFWADTYPVVSSGCDTKVIITSTPIGMNYFYKMWTEAGLGINGFVQFFAHWSENPTRDAAWGEATRKTMTEQQWLSEFETKFLGSSGTLVKSQILELLKARIPLHREDGTNSNLRLYERPVKDHEYVALCDVAEGKGKDYSVIKILDITTRPFRYAYVYRSNLITPFSLAHKVNEIGRQYNDALCIVENNNCGIETCNALWNDLNYPNVFTTVYDPLKTYGRRIAGMRTSRKTKSKGCTILKSMIELGLILVDDDLTINELLTFEENGDSYEASEGNNDDLVMTLVLFAFATTTNYLCDIMDGNSVTSTIIQDANEDKDDYSYMMHYDDGTNISHNDSYM